MSRVLSWALNNVFELSWWYPAKLSFGISASCESATVEVLKSLIHSWSFPLNVFFFFFFFFFTDFSYFLLISNKK